MTRDLTIFIIGGTASLVLIAVAALLLGPNVTVQSSNNVVHAGGDGRYILQVYSESEGLAEASRRFSVVDTKEGHVYVFRMEDAEHVLPVKPLDHEPPATEQP